MKIHIEVFGCMANKADAQAIAYIIKKEHELVELDKAELVIVASCTVKTPTEHRMIRRVINLKKIGKRVIVYGCLPQAQPHTIDDVSLVGTFALKNIDKAVEAESRGEHIVLLGGKGEDKCNLRRERKDNIEIIPISEGCLGNCSFCITKKARGQLVSFPEKSIIEQVKEAVRDGIKDIRITSQDTACYGKDNNTSLAKLLEKIIKIEGDFIVRVGMGNPQWFLQDLDNLVEVFKNKKIARFLHIPIQSGNDSVLESMNRPYTIEDFKKVVTKFREEIPDITISTDIIVGFPGETQKQFEDTLRLLEWLKPEVLNLSRYWERPGTLSATLKNELSIDDIQRRSKIIHEKYINRYSVSDNL